MVEARERCEYFVMFRCPRDCPFNDRLGDLRIRYCSFAAYADVLEPGRHTRTEIMPDGTVDYHIYPDCDVYYRYKGLGKVIRELKRRRQTEHNLGLPGEPDTATLARKHPAVSKHRRHH